jgi:hypothetical protein
MGLFYATSFDNFLKVVKADFQKTTRELLDIANKAFDNGTELEVRKLITA